MTSILCGRSPGGRVSHTRLCAFFSSIFIFAFFYRCFYLLFTQQGLVGIGISCRLEPQAVNIGRWFLLTVCRKFMGISQGPVVVDMENLLTSDFTGHGAVMAATYLQRSMALEVSLWYERFP
ncbi:hypothetical protein SCFA_740019 [anaerobic digester metagenome]|uniref:Uncharacterized protein n=1 Tax=anaerobic digester metagenome TaxID=1263854 RepID=A0A485M7D6_9ZZZZ